MEALDINPDIIIACAGAGSNLAGFFAPFVNEKKNRSDLKMIAVEAAACPTLTKGEYRYDYGNTDKTSPLIPMYTIGHDFVPAPIHSGGLRFHGMSPIVSRLYRDQLIEARAYQQLDAFNAGVIFARTEGIIPAPEACHTIKAVIDEALSSKEEGKDRTIVFCLSGNGYLDLPSYDMYMSKELSNSSLSDEDVQKSLLCLKDLPSVTT